jgi:Zn-dependent M16 (insulinase) family peptidase
MKHGSQQSPQAHPAFTWLSSHPIPTLQLGLHRYRHRNTGAEHYHLQSDNNENVFLVALRTVPQDSTGVAHILEHTVLCGSERYPVRDPFFMMIRRSLNTFMNAFTSSDWTAFPFASQNPKDFNNLLDVYLDAVFFPRLDPLDFAQEGHRLEFAESDNRDSELVYKGVVFNEMKGAMSATASILWHTLTKYLFPSTTYHYNSGGEPDIIPQLSYQQLKDFYQRHYHPSNAVFMTYGDIPAEQHQACFEQWALSRFKSSASSKIAVNNEQRLLAPLAITESYAFDEPGSTEHKTHIVLGWLLGASIDLEGYMQAHLLANVLLDNSASPLLQLLETTSLGQAPSPLCGLETSSKEMVFVCGLEGSDPQHSEALEQAVLEVLQQVADQGVPQEQVEAVLHQLELNQREVGGDHYPFGLQLILSALPAAIHGGEVAAVLDMDPVLDKLRQQIKQPDFIKGLARQLLLDNPHRVRLTLVPDADLSQRRQQAEQQSLAAIKAGLSAQQAEQIRQQSQALAKRQTQPDDPELLPKVTLADVPAQLKVPQGKTAELADQQLTYYQQSTNGLVYQQVIIDLPQLTEDLLAVLPLYAACLTELGCGQRDYLAMQRWQAQVSGGLTAYTSIRSQVQDAQQVTGHLVLSAKALSRNFTPLSELMQANLTRVNFNELSRIAELIAQVCARKEQSVTSHGHSLAMQAAASGCSASAALNHRLAGLLGIQKLKQLNQGLEDKIKLEDLVAKFRAIHQQLLQMPRQYLLINEAGQSDELIQQFARLWQPSTPTVSQPFNLTPVSQQIHQAWLINSQVSFCAKSYATVPLGHADAPALSVLGGLLRNGFLHRAVREQGGAYGAGATQDSGTASFRFFSYRDPRLAETLTDFDRAVDWLINGKPEPRLVEEAILGVISQLDKPGSPAGEAKQAFYYQLYGRTAEQRQRFRQAILAVNLADLQRVADSYLTHPQPSVAVITYPERAADCEALGLTTIQL